MASCSINHHIQQKCSTWVRGVGVRRRSCATPVACRAAGAVRTRPFPWRWGRACLRQVGQAVKGKIEPLVRPKGGGLFRTSSFPSIRARWRHTRGVGRRPDPPSDAEPCVHRGQGGGRRCWQYRYGPVAWAGRVRIGFEVGGMRREMLTMCVMSPLFFMSSRSCTWSAREAVSVCPMMMSRSYVRGFRVCTHHRSAILPLHRA